MECYLYPLMRICFSHIYICLVLAIGVSTGSLSGQIVVPPNCTQIEVDEMGNILLLAADDGKVYKSFAPEYDSVLAAGGRGFRSEGLQQPTRFALFNRNRIYVLDEAQRRTVVLSQNLRPGDVIDFLDAEAAEDAPVYPIDLALSPAGELYILDGLDGKVYMYSSFGEFRLYFGGQTYGEGSLLQPSGLAFAQQAQQVWTLDTVHQTIAVFNRFGEYRFTETLPDSFHCMGLHLADRGVFVYNTQKVFYKALTGTWRALLLPPNSTPIVSMCSFGNSLYILRGNTVHLHKL